MKQVLNTFAIIRYRDAGVHMGTVEAVAGRSVMLSNCRRLWSWEGAFTLNEVANHGVSENSRISEPVELNLLLEACEVLPVTNPEAIANLTRTRNN